MANSFKYDFKNIKSRGINLQTFDNVLVEAGYYIKNQLTNLWLSGKGGDGRAMKKLSSGYAKSKRDSGRSPIPNMNYTGSMQASLRVKKSSKSFTTAIGVSGKDANGVSNLNKLRDNQELREGIISVSKNRDIVKKVLNICYIYLRKIKGLAK